MTDPWEAQREALGAFIREQRKRANLSLRQLAELTSLSNPYLSQVERGLHQPSVRVLKALSGHFKSYIELERKRFVTAKQAEGLRVMMEGEPFAALVNDIRETKSLRLKLGFAVKLAVSRGADLSGAYLIDGGCRDFTMAEAREHWQRTRGGTSLGDETMAILDHIEAVARIRGIGR